MNVTLPTFLGIASIGFLVLAIIFHYLKSHMHEWFGTMKQGTTDDTTSTLTYNKPVATAATLRSNRLWVSRRRRRDIWKLWAFGGVAIVTIVFLLVGFDQTVYVLKQLGPYIVGILAAVFSHVYGLWLTEQNGSLIPKFIGTAFGVVIVALLVLRLLGKI
jgi:hypothetical protein